MGLISAVRGICSAGKELGMTILYGGPEFRMVDKSIKDIKLCKMLESRAISLPLSNEYTRSLDAPMTRHNQSFLDFYDAGITPFSPQVYFLDGHSSTSFAFLEDIAGLMDLTLCEGTSIDQFTAEQIRALSSMPNLVLDDSLEDMAEVGQNSEKFRQLMDQSRNGPIDLTEKLAQSYRANINREKKFLQAILQGTEKYSHVWQVMGLAHYASGTITNELKKLQVPYCLIGVTQTR